MKNILIINWRDIKNPEAGGAERYLHEIFKRIAAKGYNITLLSHYFKGALREEIIDGIRVIRKGGKFLFNYSVIPYLLQYSKKFDIIIEDINKLPFFTPLYVKTKRLHMVMHFFGRRIFVETFLPFALYVYLMEKMVSIFYRNERFVAISKSTAQEIESFINNSQNVEIIEPGIDTNFFKPVCSKSKKNVMVHIGRLMKYKNIQFVLKALPYLIREIEDLTFEIAGYGDYLDTLRKIAREYGVSDRVFFYGRVSEEKKREILSRATLFVNPSYKEGWGINNIEANLCGTVSLSANVAGLRDSVVDGVTGLLYKPDDISDFCEKAIRLFKDVSLRQKMEDAARKRALSLTWENAALKMEKCILQLHYIKFSPYKKV